MTDPADTTAADGGPPTGTEAPADPTPGVAPAPAAPAAVVYQTRLPRRGELSPGWLVGLALTWAAVIVSFAAVWNASVQLGLSTWWLGPRGDPRPLPIRLAPFAPSVVVILGAINHLRWLSWVGLAASALVVAVGVGDLGRVTSIAILEILIGLAAAAVSAASLTGTYRRAPATSSDTDGGVGAAASTSAAS